MLIVTTNNRMVGSIDWGTVLSKNPDKRKYLLQILPIENFNIKVLSCIILKESPRHGETDLLAQVQIYACSSEGVANFISSFEEKSFTTLNVKKADRIFENGKKKQFLLVLVFVNIMFKVRERVRQDRKTRTQTALVNAV